MPTIDELGRRAGAAARRAAEHQVDAEAGLRRLSTHEAVHASRPPGRRVALAVAAVAAVGLLVVGLVVVTVNRPDQTAPSDTAPVTTLPPGTTLAPSTTAPDTTPTVPPPTTVPGGGALPYNPDLLVVDVAPRTEPLALAPCDYSVCPTLATTADGRLVAFDAASRTFTVGVESGEPTTVALAEPLAATWLVTIGPDDVAYVAVDVAAGDPVKVVVAVPLAGARAGEVVATSDRMDASGDTDLVATTDGLVGVGCCGGEGPRPATGDPVLFGWVDGEGDPIAAAGPHVSVELAAGRMTGVLADGGSTLVRREIAAEVGPVRGMPRTAVTGTDSFLLAWEDVDQRIWLVLVSGDGPLQRVVVPEGLLVVHLDRFGVVVHDGSSLQRWVLPAYADAVEATAQAIDLAGSDRFVDLDALGRALVAALTEADGCEVAPTADYGVAPVSRADVPVVVEYRTGCDDSIAGGRFEVRATLTDGMWVVVSADHRSLCGRGADGTLCV